MMTQHFGSYGDADVWVDTDASMPDYVVVRITLPTKKFNCNRVDFLQLFEILSKQVDVLPNVQHTDHKPDWFGR